MNKVSWDNYNKTLKIAVAKSYAESYAEAYGFLKASLNIMKGRLEKVTKKSIEKILKEETDEGVKSRFKSILTDVDEYIEKIDKDLRKGEEMKGSFHN